jgi:Transposase IS116/IS110/IS902 family
MRPAAGCGRWKDWQLRRRAGRGAGRAGEDVVEVGARKRRRGNQRPARLVAAQMLISRSHPGRVRDEAAFACLAGVAPLEASSGQQTSTASTAAVTAP